IVASPQESQLAYDLAAKLVSSRNALAGGAAASAGGGNGADRDVAVVNALTIRGRDQVMLKVTVAEVQRDVIKQLGIDLNGSLNHGAAVLNSATSTPSSIPGQALSDPVISPQGALNNATGLPRLGATIRAMERAGVVRTLAEPNLSAISGESATFLAGG